VVEILVVGYIIFQVLGIISSVHAIMATRTPQGSIAWAISLITVPVISVPAYWVLGRSKFDGYISKWCDIPRDIEQEMEEVKQGMSPYAVDNSINFPEYEAATRLARSPLLKGNDVQLLVDGKATYDSLHQGIEEARSYILFQFYILRPDESGNRFKVQLIQKAGEGIAVYVLYDEFGSSELDEEWISDFKLAGVKIVPFNTQQGSNNRFQLNFRNHRKIVVVDGKSSWIGGLNIGNDYLGEDKKLSPWRDTHMRIDGPSSIIAQSIFSLDWYYADKHLIKGLAWLPDEAGINLSDASDKNKKEVMVLSSGPADNLETASLFFTNALNLARKRIWIATPYFIPDESTLASLKLALMKGLDVRIITPRLNDNWFVRHAANIYLSELNQLDAKIYFFEKGFMHQKVMLIDDSFSMIGTVNFDNRSFRLNFEVTGAVVDKEFASQVEIMLLNDLANSTENINYNLANESFWERFKARASGLMAPVL